MPSILILLPLLGLLVINMPFLKWARRYAFIFASLIFALQMALSFISHRVFLLKNINMSDPLFKTGVPIDHLSAMMLFLIGMVSLTSLIASRFSVYDESSRFKFINLLIVTSIGMCGIVMTRDMFSLYVFLEITAVASFILVAFKRDINALEGSFKYLMLSSIATVLLLASIALLSLVSPDMSYESIRLALGGMEHNKLISLSVGMFMCGLLIKGGLVPFHGWLPDAYMSSSPSISILLGGIVTKTCGIYTLMRIAVTVFGSFEHVRTMLLIFGAISVLVGAAAALEQTHFRRMLAYSSISQVGYIVLGIGAGNVLGLVGGAFHLFNHAIFKSLLFVNASAIESETGTNNITKMGGIAERMPVTGLTSIIGMLSACGIPPLAGFWSKLLIVVALWRAGLYSYAAVAILASVLTLAYFLALQRQVFFGKLSAGLDKIKEAHACMAAISIALALVTILAGLLFPYMMNNYMWPIKDLMVR